MDKIIIYGIGDFAKTLSTYIYEERAYDILAYVVDEAYLPINTTYFNNKPLYSFEEFINKDGFQDVGLLLAVGYSNMRARKKMFENAVSSDKKIVNFISNKSIIHSSIKMGEGNIVLPGTIIEANVEIGDNNIFWSSVNISHDTKIGNHSFFASQSLIGGFCKVKDNCFFGFNSTVLQSTIIEEETLVGACSLVNINTTACSKYLGVPALKVDSHKESGIRIK